MLLVRNGARLRQYRLRELYGENLLLPRTGLAGQESPLKTAIT